MPSKALTDSRPPTYAVLGASGLCGTALIENLLQSPTTKIYAYCQNKHKLLTVLPQVHENRQVEIFQGSIHDVNLIVSCIRGAQAVFLVISTNGNIPGCRMAQDTAASVLSALKMLRVEHSRTSTESYRAPKLVLLSSASLDAQLSRNTPPLVHQLLLRSASHVYHDLRESERLLREQEDWVSTISIKPGGLSVDIQRGHALSFTEERSPLSYLDLAAAMIEAADDEHGTYDGKNVGVVCSGGEAQFARGAPWCMFFGLVRHYFPFLHPYLPSTGPN